MLEVQRSCTCLTSHLRSQQNNRKWFDINKSPRLARAKAAQHFRPAELALTLQASQKSLKATTSTKKKAMHQEELKCLCSEGLAALRSAGQPRQMKIYSAYSDYKSKDLDLFGASKTQIKVITTIRLYIGFHRLDFTWTSLFVWKKWGRFDKTLPHGFSGRSSLPRASLEGSGRIGLGLRTAREALCLASRKEKCLW